MPDAIRHAQHLGGVGGHGLERVCFRYAQANECSRFAPECCMRAIGSQTHLDACANRFGQMRRGQFACAFNPLAPPIPRPSWKGRKSDFIVKKQLQIWIAQIRARFCEQRDILIGQQIGVLNAVDPASSAQRRAAPPIACAATGMPKSCDAAMAASISRFEYAGTSVRSPRI